MGFLQGMMVQMGFSIQWVDFMMKCVSTVSYSVCLNGKLGPSFHLTRGLRQRDPLSQYLFLICSEGLSSLLRLAKQEGILSGVKASRSGPIISHLLFVDNCTLFGEASLQEVQRLKSILKEYEVDFGQCVNFDKSSVFLVQIFQQRHVGR